ncbi:hypothetical protein CLV81_0371 [Flagellimonas meridianipacifica]|uniref:Uncharacterized protein n=1 Tax=Flagellimonas meridianipacifica TaxID=1080225 RepID=A0A2T0MFN7_9FLAO|nr:hypothetical protein CLV81_0371 [Allomuricauda pacifica]
MIVLGNTIPHFILNHRDYYFQILRKMSVLEFLEIWKSYNYNLPTEPNLNLDKYTYFLFSHSFQSWSLAIGKT